MAEVRKDLLNKVRIALRASGVVVKAVPAFIQHIAGRNTPTELTELISDTHTPSNKKKQATFAKFYKQEGHKLAGICKSDKLQQEFVEKMLGYAKGTGNERGLRPDSVTIMAYTMVGKDAKNRNYELAGVASYCKGTFTDTEDNEIEFVKKKGFTQTAAQITTLNEDLQKGGLMEIDLVCASSAAGHHIPGLATLLVIFCIAVAARQKKKKLYRYTGCIIDCVDPRMMSLAKNIGFRNVMVTKKEPGQSNEEDEEEEESVETYMVLHGADWLTKIVKFVQGVPNICMIPGSAICQ